jgi:DNA-binding NtrC family response regulator
MRALIFLSYALLILLPVTFCFTTPGRTQLAKILLIEYVHESLERRRRGLSAAGHTVASAQNLAEGLRAIQSRKFDVVVLGHAIPRQQRNNLAAAAKKASPLTRVLVLYSARVDQAELADALMDNTASAEDLRRTVEYLVDSRTP